MHQTCWKDYAPNGVDLVYIAPVAVNYIFLQHRESDRAGKFALVIFKFDTIGTWRAIDQRHAVSAAYIADRSLRNVELFVDESPQMIAWHLAVNHLL